MARAKLRSALVDQKIALYMMQPDEDCVDLMMGLGLTLSVIGTATVLQDITPLELPALKAGLDACNVLADTGLYNPEHTVAITAALDAAETINRELTADSILKAWELLK